MELTIYQIDAFTTKTFGGNPAAVIPLESWLDDEVMQNIAMENNLSETAFFTPKDSGFELRWFTPVDEVDMCGHATLASAHVLFYELGYQEQKIHFYTKSGELIVEKEGELLRMDFPAQEIVESDAVELLGKALGKRPIKVYKSMDYLAVFENEEDVKNLKPDQLLCKELDLRGIIATARSEKYDFICRMFAPKYGIEEDPVTGSAFTQLITYWSKKTGKNCFNARQASKRGGDVICELIGNRCIIKGASVKFMEGKITIS